MASRRMALQLQTLLQSGSSAMLVSSRWRAAISSGLSAGSGCWASPQNQSHSSRPHRLRPAEDHRRAREAEGEVRPRGRQRSDKGQGRGAGETREGEAQKEGQVALGLAGNLQTGCPAGTGTAAEPLSDAGRGMG